MGKEKIYLILQTVFCILFAVFLAAAAVFIYEEGAVRKSEDPMESIYTPENVTEKLGMAVPFVLAAAGFLAAGLVLGVKDVKAEKPKGPGKAVRPKAEGKSGRILQAVIIIAAIVFIFMGVLNGSARDVLIKAITICSECIGLG